MPATVLPADSHVFHRVLDSPYPNVERAEGVWLYCTDGQPILDAISGGAMVTSLGYGVPELVQAAASQAERIAYMYNHHFTSEPQEQLADRLLTLAAPDMARVRFVSGGSEANETAIQLARSYHVERGDDKRWRVISPAQAYHGATMGTLALSGRAGLHGAQAPYLARHLHIAPSTWRFDPTGEAALAALDSLLEEAGDTVSAFFCEPISAAAFPAYSPPEAFWRGLAERRDSYGFLICFDEVVTGMGRVGSWFAADQLPLRPDIIATGKGLGAGYAPLAAVICNQHVFDQIDDGSRQFDIGHTWDGAPLPCAVGLAVLDQLESRQLIPEVRDRGAQVLDGLRSALDGSSIVREVRGRGFLFGVEIVDPRDGHSILPDELHADALIDDAALRAGLLVSSTHSNVDGYTGDQTLLAPAFTSTDDELDQMIQRFSATIADVEDAIIERLR